MARPAARKKPKQVDDYRHEEAKRLNIPPAGLAWQDTEKPPKRRFEYDPHLDPQLVWSGKAERTTFEVEAPSIHVHERLSTEAIIRAVRKEPPQPALFGDEELDRSKTVEFYQHEQGWVNRLILGDSLVVMTSLLEKERLGGQVQMIYLDPPYEVTYNSNFQARISNRTPKEGADDSLTREPEQVQAFRDTWTLGVHSYLTYLRDRLLIARELLIDTGSIFVQIGPKNVHLIRGLLDEVFGAANACPTITIAKTSQEQTKLLPDVADFLLWYGKDIRKVKYFPLYEERGLRPDDFDYRFVEEPDGTRRPMSTEERRNPETLVKAGFRIFRLDNATSEGFSAPKTIPFEFDGRVFHPGPNRHWLLRKEGMEGLAEARRLATRENSLAYVRFWDDFGGIPRTNVWLDTSRAGAWGRKKAYVVETNPKILERCLAMTTEPGDLILDPTSGSGTMPWAAEKLGRRWVAIDTSRVALSLSRERILTGIFDYYRLQDPERNVDGGFLYRTLTRVTASSIGYEESPQTALLHDQPLIDRDKVRVSGPFTVEALSRYSVNPMLDEVPPEPDDPQASEAQDHMETLLDALRKQGIPVKGRKQPLKIESLQRLANVGAIQAEGTYTANGASKTLAVSLGPRFGPVTFNQINEAMKEAMGYDLVVFAGFAATAEAQQVIAKGALGGHQVALLEANPDLLVGDLLKATPSSQTFRLFSSPDVQLKAEKNGEVRVEVLGVDTFDASTGEVRSAGQKDIAAWFLDQDYDGIVFHVNQAFFPKSGSWEALQRALKGTIDPDLMEQLESFESLPFTPGENWKAAVRLVEDSGSLSEVVLDLEK
jgi:adenine-specific DNA-methyltransferase